MTPLVVAQIIFRRDHRTLHMQVTGENHEPRIIPQRTQHQDGSHRRRPSLCRRGAEPGVGECAQTGVDPEQTDAAYDSDDQRAPAQAFIEKGEMEQKEQDPDAGDLARAEREQTGQGGESVERSLRDKPSRFTRADKQKPAGAGEEKGEAVRAAGDVINRGAVHRMNDPEESDEKGAK